MPDTPRPLSRNILFITPAAVVFLLFLAILAFISSSSGNTVKNIILGLYPLTSANIVTVSGVNGINIMVFFYAVFPVSVLISFLISLAARSAIRNLNAPGLKATMTICAISLFFSVLSVQTAQRVHQVSGEIRTFSGKTPEEKKTLLFGATYRFAELCLARLEGKHKALLITDLRPDISSLDHNTRANLSYHLFPIDIRNILSMENDCMLIFSRTKPDFDKDMIKQFPDIITFGEYYGIALKKRPGS
ncbi:MAG: hypothetical protein HQL30_04215 [Candidatus Omnitrophica bacterium]|nr:hypothetical protein [Candidatus Omnitrophota bacterium]